MKNNALKAYISVFRYIFSHLPEIVINILKGKTLTLTYDDRLSKIEDRGVFNMKVKDFLKETKEKYNGKTILIDDYGLLWVVENIGDEKKSKEIFDQVIALQEKEQHEADIN